MKNEIKIREEKNNLGVKKDWCKLNPACLILILWIDLQIFNSP